MLLPDVNVLVRAFRRDSPNHIAYRDWLDHLVNSDRVFAMSELVLSGFVRIVTHPRIFKPPSSTEDALRFVTKLRSRSNCAVIVPGSRHWEIFIDLCLATQATGNLVPDAYLAALAIESGSEWVTADRDFARFPGLRWRHPFA